MQSQSERGNQFFIIGECANKAESDFTVPTCAIKELKRRVTIPIDNISGKMRTLKKGLQTAEINAIETSGIEIDNPCLSYDSILNLNELKVGELDTNEEKKLFKLV